MQFGIAIPTAADSWRLVRRAEELGFSHAWFFDTQMLSADPFVAMAAAAMKTTRIKLGTGVLIPSNRIAPVAANAFASLNKLAPGTHRVRHQHRLHRPSHHGSGRGEARRHGRIYPDRPGAVARRDRRDGAGRQTPADPHAQSRAWPDQHAGSHPAVHRRLRSACAQAHRETRRCLDRQCRRCRARHRNTGTDAHSVAGSRPCAR